MNKDKLLLIFFCAIGIYSSAQERFGMANSNWSPTATMLHNPSSIVDSDVMLDVQVGGLAAFLHTNYAYLPGDEFNFLKHATSGNFPNAQFNSGREKYSAYSSVDIQYLTATYQYKTHGFGLLGRVRTFVDVREVPEIFANAFKFPQIVGESTLGPELLFKDFEADDININALSYGEYGFSYANAVRHFDRNLLIVGGTAKFLVGIGGGGMNIKNFDYRIDTTGFNYSNLEASTVVADQLLSGLGWGFDIGFTYKRMLDNVTSYSPFKRSTGCRIYNYKFKAAMSLIDVGGVTFYKDVRSSHVRGVSGTLDDFTELSVGESPEEVLTETLGVDEDAIQTDTNRFFMNTPAAFVLQTDYNFEKNNMYFSFEYMQGLTPNSAFGIQRPQVVVFTPRYETRHFEVALPFGMYNLQEVRTGLMVRLGPLTLGTDKLGTFLSMTDVTGFDFYFHLAFKLIQDRDCGKRRYW